MKAWTLFLLFVVANISYAQDYGNDGYHANDEPKCSRATCLFVKDTEIGLYEYQDRDGNKYLELNNQSYLLDIDYSTACFVGDINEVQTILEYLTGNTNTDYYQGGHQLVKEILFTNISNNVLEANLLYRDDYVAGDQKLQLKLNRCQK